ncbi:uncharacterized protein LOC105694218 [Orussus abietinus]|uniref:uncharacterized protein LOC105694218 n=1 Tax=Orussus abietinus TaxID=222816 RepID=UPI0006266DDD|nr:uncharacterized protein LOC105694218 [Orussus abietinus]
MPFAEESAADSPRRWRRRGGRMAVPATAETEHERDEARLSGRSRLDAPGGLCRLQTRGRLANRGAKSRWTDSLSLFINPSIIEIYSTQISTASRVTAEEITEVKQRWAGGSLVRATSKMHRGLSKGILSTITCNYRV